MSELERIIHDNSNGLDYILVGEIYLPLIAVPEEKREIGFYGSLHRNYLKDYKSGLYSYLTLSGKLWTYLADLNEQCLERRDFLMEQIMEQALAGFAPNVLDEQQVRYQCDCSQARVERALLSLGRDELAEMAAEGKPVEVSCHFCDKKYYVDAGALLGETKG